MKRALVIGASGGMGYSIVNELASRGIEVTAFARDRERLERLFGTNPYVTIFPGDLFEVNDLEDAAKGSDVIFQSANLPYSDWEKKLPIMISNILQTAKNHSARLAFVDNIYAYGRSFGYPVSENTGKTPHTKKGKIRLAMEELIRESGVPSVIAHFPDFYGPQAENTLLNFTLVDIAKNKRSRYVGSKEIAREFIYTPDGAKALVELCHHEHAYGENWNIAGPGVITGSEIITNVRELTGYQKGVSIVSKNMIRLLGLFNKQMAEAVELFYLNEEPVLLDSEKYEQRIGPLPRTPYREGLKETIKHLAAHG